MSVIEVAITCSTQTGAVGEDGDLLNLGEKKKKKKKKQTTEAVVSRLTRFRTMLGIRGLCRCIFRAKLEV